MNVVEVEGLSVRYGRRVALDGVSLTLPRGAAGLLGPNGAGKSTLMKTLLGFLRADSGWVRVLGHEMPAQALEVRQRIGFMPERDLMSPKVSAVSFLVYCGRLHGMSRPDAMERTHAVHNYVGVGESRYRKMETYSKGMCQRVKFAQAIIHDPKLLLLDEPTNGLDPAGRIEMLESIGTSRTVGGAALAFAVAFALHAGAEPAKDSYKETVDKTFALMAGGTFTLENRNGSIELSTWDKDEVRVVAEKQMKIGGGWRLARLIGIKQSPIETDADAQALFAQLAVEFSGDEKGRTVMTRYPESRDVNCTVSYRITAPRKTKVDLNTVNGSIQVGGVEGEVAVSTTSGSISIP